MSTDLSLLNPTQRRFANVFGDQFEVDAPLSRNTSTRVGGNAEMLVTIRNTEELKTAVEMAYSTNVRYFILGGGSNVLVADEGIAGLVIINRARNVTFRSAGASIICRAESGANLSTLARQCNSKGLGGLEWAIGVPGTLGGAVVGNSGAFGGDMSDNVVMVEVWEPGKGIRNYSIDELAYNYRTSTFKKDHGKLKARRIILAAELRLKPEPAKALLARAEAFNEKRKNSQPGGASTGSMFKNPPNYYAGYLIEAAGLKGYRNGQASISEKHANFFINHGGATAEDIRGLVAEAWHQVREKFHVEMELEVELVGDWDFESG
ncbi:MAG: UDP-N-acetylmuramate dehydrogenase [Chloroflexota bacterium]